MNFDKFKHDLVKKFSGYFGKDIDEKEAIKDFLHFFINENNDFLAIDFLDASNWDSILRYSYSVDTGELEAIWHDFSDVHPEDDLALISRDYFGAGIEKLFLKIEFAKIGLFEGNYPYLLLRGYHQDDKDINKKWNTKCTSFTKYSINFFTQEIRRVVKGKSEEIIIPTVNVYSTIIVPKEVDERVTHKILFSENRSFASEKIQKQITKLESNNLSKDEISETGNPLRIAFEHFLKIFVLEQIFTEFKEVEFKDNNGNSKDYQHLMLGDLVKPFKEFLLDKNLIKDLEETVEILNRF